MQCANVQRARVNARSGTRTTQRKIGNGAFCHTSASTRGRRCNPLLATYHTSVCLRHAAYRAHISVPSYNRHLDSEERCTNHVGLGGPCHTFAFHKMYCGSRHVLHRLSRSISRRHHHGTRAALPAGDDFQWFPRFFNLVEQHALLSAALRKLDAAEPRASRKRRRDFLASRHRPTLDQQRTHCAGVLEDYFLPGDLYHFEEVRH